jgi:hypothetical protein
MARYYFHLDNGDRIDDDEGTDCTTFDHAKIIARQVASELGAHQTQRHNEDIWLTVTDERGVEVFRLSLADKSRH